MKYRIIISVVAMTLLTSFISFTKSKDDSGWANLLDQNLSQWEMYLGYNHKASYNGSLPVDEHGDTIKPVGYNKNVNNVFSVISDNGDLVLKVTGEYYGCVFTKTSYKNFQLKLKVKFGTKKWAARRLAGKVGTGFNTVMQKEMMAQFTLLITDQFPFDIQPTSERASGFRPSDLGQNLQWLKPELVCEVNFAEVTEDGIFRQASFKGLRTDKKAKEVVLEVPQDTQQTVEAVQEEIRPPREAVKPPQNKERRTLLNPNEETQVKKICGHELKFTNLSKLYWPEDGVTKRDMFNYYYQVAEYILPYLLDRPMSLNRFPGGIHGQSFYQKDVRGKSPDWITKTFPYTTSEGEYKEYLVGSDESYLLWMASLGCIEMNPWFSRVQSPDCPDFCVIDLDPDQNTFEQVIQAAQKVKELLDAIDVPCYPKTSGSTGMHIYIPLHGQYSYDQSQLFAKIIVTQVHEQMKEFTSLERNIKDRGGKMYLDFLQNRPGATIAGAYSLRPKPGATVSMPLSWDEVKPGLTMRDFTIFNAVDRLKETGDLFKGVLGKGIDLVKTIKNAQNVFK
jgi:bifunctional non-homologous end joining protein LigD